MDRTDRMGRIRLTILRSTLGRDFYVRKGNKNPAHPVNPV